MQKEYFSDLYRYRELLYFLAWRDILVRYKQAFFGVSWALFRPLLNMILFAFLFGHIAQLPSGDVNYGIFVLAGLLPWQLCSNATVDTCNSLVNCSHLISKIYFPRIIIPLAQIIVHFVDFCLGFILLLVMTVLFQGSLPWSVLTLPAFILLAIILCIGPGLWLSACTVQYRDFRIIVPFFIQFGMFLAPVGYSSAMIPEKWQWLYFLNPMVGLIDGFRWALFGSSPDHLLFSIASSLTVSILILGTGLLYFRSMERTFADRI